MNTTTAALSSNVTEKTFNFTKGTDSSLDGHDYVKSEDLDHLFRIVMGMIVFFMQAGFAFLEAGAVRSKNATNILLKNILDCFLGGIVYWLVGYAFAYGAGNSFIGYEYFASTNMPSSHYSQWFFQYVFAAAAATIVSGSVAERCNITAYFIYSIVITGFIYPVITHWVWSSEGWLGNSPYTDFAGSGVVHMTGGISALVGAVFLGPRRGRFCDKTNKPLEIRGHSVPMAALGGFILMFGFLAFNGGSQLTISGSGDGTVVSLVIMNTVLAGSAAGITGLVIHRSGLLDDDKSWSFLMTLNCALTGMVCVCAGCNLLTQWGSVIMGAVAGLVFLLCHRLMLICKVDDPLDAVGVHFGGGVWALLATPFFISEGSLFTGSTDAALMLAWNIAGGLAITAWAGGLCCLLFGFMKYANILRISTEMEIRGMDKMKGEPAYPRAAWLEEETITGPHQMGESSLSEVIGSKDSGKPAVVISSDEAGHSNPNFVPEKEDTSSQYNNNETQNSKL